MAMVHCGSLLCGTGQPSVGPPPQFSARYNVQHLPKMLTSLIKIRSQCAVRGNTRVIAVETNCVGVYFCLLFFVVFFSANADQTCRLNV